jgi:hypothetical protein
MPVYFLCKFGCGLFIALGILSLAKRVKLFCPTADPPALMKLIDRGDTSERKS